MPRPKTRHLPKVAVLISACMMQAEPSAAQESASTQNTTATDQAARQIEIVELQAMLDRARHSPGVIDGVMGGNTRRAIEAYQKSSGMSQTGRIDDALVRRLRQSHGSPVFQEYLITKEDVDGPFRNVPSAMTGKAELDRVAFEDAAELLAEKFHMGRSFLEKLNPGADFSKAGTKIKVIRPGDDEQLTKVQRIEVDKQTNELRAYSPDGIMIATYPTTVGSNIHPSPNETLTVLAVAPDPKYYFDPSGRTWGPNEQLTIAPGPNNPVGVVWIDLSRDGYGIHGTPEPRLIGKTSSHGCVRLTNWDAHELSLAVEKGTTVHFR